jgi:hypothetical protein
MASAGSIGGGNGMFVPAVPSSRFGGLATQMLVLVMLIALTLGMTWPLVLNLTEAIPGPPWDNMVWLYDLWWLRHSVVDLGQLPSFNATIFAPFGYDLRLSETMLANKVLIAPFLFWGNEVLAYNMLLLLSFVLTGYTTYLLVAYLTGNQYAAMIAGIIMAFSPFRFHAMAAGWLPLISTQWMPLTFLFLERTIREGRTRYAWWAGLFTALTLLSSWYYVYVFGSMLVVYLLVRLRPWRQTLHQRRLLLQLVFAGVVTLALIAPVALPVVTHPTGQMGWPIAEVEKWSASVEDLVLPNIYHPVWGQEVLAKRALNLRYPWYAPGFIYVGLVALVLAMWGIMCAGTKRGLVAPFVWLAVVSAVLALGVVLHYAGQVVQVAVPDKVANPYVRVMSTLMSKWALNKGSLYEIAFSPGHVPIPLPALLVYLFVPLGSALRSLYRFGFITAFAVSVLAGMGAAHLLGGLVPPEADAAAEGRVDWHMEQRTRYLGRTTLTVVLIALVLFDFLSAPLAFGFSDVRPQPIDRWLAAQPDTGSVMQFPLARALSGDALYRSKYHGKPVAYGHGTFYPQQYRYNMPLLAEFPSRDTLELLLAWGVRYVVVGSGAYGAGWGDQEGQTWASVEAEIARSPHLTLLGVTFDEPVWRDEWVSSIIQGNLPVEPLLVDKLYVYELK